jgi:thiamine transporter ThiT
VVFTHRLGQRQASVLAARVIIIGFRFGSGLGLVTGLRFSLVEVLVGS